jgi:hypothetical protein
VFAYAGVEPPPVNIERPGAERLRGHHAGLRPALRPGYREGDYDLIRQWQQKAAHVGKYDYYGLGAIIPRYYPHLIAEDIKHSQQVGLEGFHSEAYPLWPQFGPQIYVAARMLYNPSLDCDKLLSRTSSRTSTARPRRRWRRCTRPSRRPGWTTSAPGKWFEGIGSMSEQISMYRPEHLAAVRAHLRKAKQLADTDLIRSGSRTWTRGWSTR